MPSARRVLSSSTTSIMAWGGGKNGSGKSPYFAVMSSHTVKNSASAIIHGESACRRRRPGYRASMTTAAAIRTARAPKMAARSSV